MTSTNAVQAIASPTTEAVFATLSVPPGATCRFVRPPRTARARRTNVAARAREPRRTARDRPTDQRHRRRLDRVLRAARQPERVPARRRPLRRAGGGSDSRRHHVGRRRVRRALSERRTRSGTRRPRRTHVRSPRRCRARRHLRRPDRSPASHHPEPSPGRTRAPDRHRSRLGSEDPLDRRHRHGVRSAGHDTVRSTPRRAVTR